MGPRWRWWRHQDADRGATGVEYALIAALVLVGSLGAINALERNADDYYDTTSSRIGSLPSANGGAPTGTSLPGGSTSTTAAPTTTTTAAPTTTTTAAPTTTTTAAPRSSISATADSSDTTGFNSWRAAVTVTIRNTSTGANVANAGVTVAFTRTNGTSLGSATCTTGSNGQCLARLSGVADSIATVVARVTSVSANPTWDGATATRTLPHP